MRASAAAIGGIALAAICCAAAPVALAVVAGLSVAVFLGWAGLLIALCGVSVLAIARVRRAMARREDR
jgi:membrane protein implicated in regulation of membrane protease activity